MIRYGKGWWGTGVLVRMYGSSFPRALPFSLSATALAVVLALFLQDTLAAQFTNPYPYQTFAFIVGFMIVFRSNLSYGRYNDGRSHLATLVSKLSDATEMCLNFDRMKCHPSKNPTEEDILEHEWFRNTLIHLMSLMHAVALATLRVDFNMENIVIHDSSANAPRSNIHRQINNDKIIAQEKKGAKRVGGTSVSTPRPIKTLNTPAAHAGANAYDGADGSKDPETPPRLYTASAGRHSWRDFFILNRDTWAYTRVERPPHEMHWFYYVASDTYMMILNDHAPDDKLCDIPNPKQQLGAETEMHHAQYIYSVMKLPVIGGLTQAEGIALGAFVTSGKEVKPVPDLNLGIHGFMLPNGTYAPAPTERVHTILSWVHQLIIERMDRGGITAPPPVQSRIHQVISDAMLGYEHCKKLMDTPFPFPWAQAVNFVLILFSFTLPFVVVAHTTGITVAACITFAAVQTHVMLNEVARDIEDPYLYDPNELPLPQMQYKLNERLLAIAHSRRPVAFTDVAGLAGPGNTALLPDVTAPTEVGGLSKQNLQGSVSMQSYQSLPVDVLGGTSTLSGDSPEGRFKTLAPPAFQVNAGSFMSGNSPLASAYSEVMDRGNIHRPVVETASDLLNFSTQNTEAIGTAYMGAFRGRAIARSTDGPSAPSGIQGDAVNGTKFVQAEDPSGDQSTTSNDQPKPELEGTLAMEPQVIVDVQNRLPSVNTDEAQVGLLLPLGQTGSPFDEASQSSAKS